MLKQSTGLSFGNGIYTIEFSQKESFPKYGAKYVFTLLESVDKCPEYLVHPQVLKEYHYAILYLMLSLAAKYDMELESSVNFITYFEHHRNNPNFRSLLQRMKVFNEQGDMSKEEWEAAGLIDINLH